MGRDSKHEKCQKSEKLDFLKVKNLCVKTLKALNIDTKNLTADNAIINNLNVTNINGRDVTCQTGDSFTNLNEELVFVGPSNEKPPRPENISQIVYDTLWDSALIEMERIKTYLQCGRSRVQNINQQNGCIVCPSSELPTEPCPELCEFICTVPPTPCGCEETAECPSASIHIYGIKTVSPFIQNLNCNTISTQLISYIGHNLNILNVACDLGVRVVSVLVQTGYVSNSINFIGNISGNILTVTQLTGTLEVGQILTGENVLENTVIVQDLGNNQFEINFAQNLVNQALTANTVVIQQVDLASKQFERTLNLWNGEKYKDLTPLPSALIDEMLAVMPPSIANNAAVQMVIYVEQDIEVLLLPTPAQLNRNVKQRAINKKATKKSKAVNAKEVTIAQTGTAQTNIQYLESSQLQPVGNKIVTTGIYPIPTLPNGSPATQFTVEIVGGGGGGGSNGGRGGGGGGGSGYRLLIPIDRTANPSIVFIKVLQIGIGGGPNTNGGDTKIEFLGGERFAVILGPFIAQGGKGSIDENGGDGGAGGGGGINYEQNGNGGKGSIQSPTNPLIIIPYPANDGEHAFRLYPGGCGIIFNSGFGGPDADGGKGNSIEGCIPGPEDPPSQAVFVAVGGGGGGIGGGDSGGGNAKPNTGAGGGGDTTITRASGTTSTGTGNGANGYVQFYV